MAGGRYYYRAFGRTIQSACRLPLLLPATPEGEPAISIHNGRYPPQKKANMRPWVRSRALTPSDKPWLTMWRLLDDGGFHLRFGDGEEVTIDGSGRHIWSPHLSTEAAAPITGYLYGIILGLAFYLQGGTCLHASAVAVGGQAVLFAGDAGFGKSSTAVTLLGQGFPLLTDDLAVLDPPAGPIRIPPAFPALRLRSDFAASTFGRDHRLPPLDGDAGKVLYRLEKTDEFFEESAPLSVIYLLSSRAGRSGDGLHIRPVGRRDALIALSQGGYLPYLMDRDMRRAEFEMLSAVVRSVPVFQLPALPDPAHLPQLCQAILQHGSRL